MVSLSHLSAVHSLIYHHYYISFAHSRMLMCLFFRSKQFAAQISIGGSFLFHSFLYQANLPMSWTACCSTLVGRQRTPLSQHIKTEKKKKETHASVAPSLYHVNMAGIGSSSAASSFSSSNSSLKAGTSAGNRGRSVNRTLIKSNAMLTWSWKVSFITGTFG